MIWGYPYFGKHPYGLFQPRYFPCQYSSKCWTRPSSAKQSLATWRNWTWLSDAFWMTLEMTDTQRMGECGEVLFFHSCWCMDLYDTCVYKHIYICNVYVELLWYHICVLDVKYPFKYSGAYWYVIYTNKHIGWLSFSNHRSPRQTKTFWTSHGRYDWLMVQRYGDHMGSKWNLVSGDRTFRTRVFVPQIGVKDAWQNLSGSVHERFWIMHHVLAHDNNFHFELS